MSEFTTEGLRRYGPGKYDLEIDAILDNMDKDEECGDVSEVGHHYGLVRGPITPEEIGEFDRDTECTDAEREFLYSIAGAIVTTAESGAVTVEYFENSLQLEAKWVEIENQVSAFYDWPDEYDAS